MVEGLIFLGVETDKGETIRAAAVAAGINPKLLYLHLVDVRALPEGFRRRMENWRCGSGTFRMNVALSELPDFTALPGREPAEHHASGIIIAPSLAYMEQAYFDARTFGWSRRPIIELVIPSTLDGTLAPRGQHVASLFCQHVAPKLADGSSWDDHREAVADLMIETLNDHAPNFRRSVLARQIFSPLDLERTFGLIGGDIFHGALDLRQIFSARPMLGYADYRGPIAGLFCAVLEAIREAASPVRRATMPLGRSCVTSSASASPGFDSACMKTIGISLRLSAPFPLSSGTRFHHSTCDA